MIYSSLSQKCNRAQLPRVVQRALGEIDQIWAKTQGNSPSGLAPGRYEIEGARMYYLVQHGETAALNDRNPESHTEYVDLQFLLRGTESIGVAGREGLEVRDTKPEKDVMFYDNAIVKESFIHLSPGEFCVFFPDDVHRPLCTPSQDLSLNRQVEKIVVKIHISLFAENH